MSELVQYLRKEKERILQEIERQRILLASVDNLLAEHDKEDKQLSVSNPLATTALKFRLQPVEKKTSSLRSSVKKVVLGLTEFTRSTEITEALLQIYPDKSQNAEGFQVQISGILSSLGKANEIGKYQFSGSKKDTVWGKNEWLDQNGKPKEGFYNEK